MIVFYLSSARYVDCWPRSLKGTSLTGTCLFNHLKIVKPNYWFTLFYQLADGFSEVGI